VTARHPEILIIGAGIVGAAIAYRLAVRGANVMLVDEARAPGCGVTGRAFGWINIINGTPTHQNYPLWQRALDAYGDLRQELPHVLQAARPGALVWKATREETEDFGRLRQDAGEPVQLLDSDALSRLEPRLRNPPDLAVFSPQDLALDPAALARSLVAEAVKAGASTRFGQPVSAIETVAGRATGIHIAGEMIAADTVVLSAGAGVGRLAADLGIEIGLQSSPALLLRYGCSAPVVGHILKTPRVEVRQAPDHALLVAKSWSPDADADRSRKIGEAMLSVLQEEFDLPDGVTLLAAEVGVRPMLADGMPRLGYLPGVSGVYLAVGHPGVILAPLLGTLAADEILNGKATGLTASLASGVNAL